ncbi:hypothetical protein BC834DRAFT_827152 [Gloeopeniophorella convolvens]|nr:hypothetical protein BC834DRAFT_827152 [Gloeopeniophorella convolvens]
MDNIAADLPQFFRDIFDDESEDDFDFVLDEDAGSLTATSSDASDQEEPHNHRQPWQHARYPTSNLGADVCTRAKAVLDFMNTQGLDLGMFLNAVCWGDKQCTSDPQIRGARTRFLSSGEFLDLLQRWWKPPGGKADVSRAIIEGFAADCVKESIQDKMRAVAKVLTSPGDPLSLETLTSLSFPTLSAELQESAPLLWDLLLGIAWSKSQEKRNTSKRPNNVSPWYQILRVAA